MYWIIKNEFILAILAAVIVGGYRRAAPTTINQSIVTTQIGWIVHWVSASAQTSPNANSNQSVNANSINQSTNQSIIISNKSINQNWIQSITQKCKQIFNQSINTVNFQVHEMNEAAEYWVHSSICVGVRRKREDEDSPRRIRNSGSTWKITKDKQQ